MKRMQSEYDAFPRWYGFAYYLPHLHVVVCYPIPLNVIVGIGWWLYCKLRRGVEWDNLLLETHRTAYLEGRRIGWASGVEDGKALAKQEAEERVKEYFATNRAHLTKA